MANAYFYSNIAVPTTLSGNINNAVTSCTVAATTGWPTSYPFIIAIDYGGAAEELVRVTNNAAGTLTIVRAFGGTSAVAHSIGAVVRHVHNAQDDTDFRTHEQSASAVHGVTGALVGLTDTQTLTNKTLTSPTINAGALSGTFTGAPNFTGAPSFRGAVTTSAVFTARVTGFSNDTFQLSASGGMDWGGGGGAFDTNLYRSNSNTLQTDDQFVSTRPLLTDATYVARRASDTNARFYMTAGGTATFGDGAGAMDTNLYRSAADTLKTDDSFVVGTNLSVTGNITASGVGAELHARKTADTSVTNNTVSSDPHLVVAVPANSIWEMVGCLFYTSASLTPDIFVQFSAPAGASGFWTAIGPNTSATSDPPNDTASAGSGNRTIAGGPGTGRSYGVPVAGSVFGLELKGMFEIAGTSGNISVDWAQQTTNATATTMKIYSWFRLTRVA